MASTTDIVAKLWNLCNVLRDDGITYHEYVTELTYLLFLKMAEETETDNKIPKGYRWKDLNTKDGIEQLNFYKEMLLHLGTKGSGYVKEIYNDATTAIRQPKNLRKLVESINDLEWYSAREEGLGDLYEGLLEKNASEKKSGAGQYFTQRPLIDSMVEVLKPQAGETIQDPACGTGGFLIAAHRYISEKNGKLYDLAPKQQDFQRREALNGMELVPDTYRLALMNALLHGIEGTLSLGDTLSPDGKKLKNADVILTNPPFGSKKGGEAVTRDDFTYKTNNKQLAFLEHVYRSLQKETGRAGIVVPDNVLFEGNIGVDIRRDLMNKCNLHTILRLPTGIFYAQGVKTNVLFFTRGKTDKDNTKKVWVYDMRANMPSFGKRTVLTSDYFKSFEKCYGKKGDGTSKRTEGDWTWLKEDTPQTMENSRWRCFTREWIAEQKGDSLDISWLKDDENVDSENLPEPEVLAAEALSELTEAVKEIGELMRALGCEEDAKEIMAEFIDFSSEQNK
ncbi:MAG TPA: N-6 DNA methylase [Chitinispirillaceae bacterium]|nr:N-6 DNA methylase [Chitinispirillaceae bacterium]